MIKKLYPSFNGKYVYGTYDQNFDLAKGLIPSETYSGDRPLRVLLGNSSDPTNNHIDACRLLLKTLKVEKRIICPLSYGDPVYSNIFQQWAQNHLQEQFSPITHFMNREDYINFLNKVDIVIMYHNRQQALGNIITSLVLGKPVFLKPNNPVCAMLKNMGIPNLYDIFQIGNLNLSEVCRESQYHKDSCVSKIKKIFSEQARLENLRDLIM